MAKMCIMNPWCYALYLENHNYPAGKLPLSNFLFYWTLLYYRRIMRLDDFGKICFNASFGSSFSSSCIKTGERSIVRLDEVNRLVRLNDLLA